MNRLVLLIVELLVLISAYSRRSPMRISAFDIHNRLNFLLISTQRQWGRLRSCAEMQSCINPTSICRTLRRPFVGNLNSLFSKNACLRFKKMTLLILRMPRLKRINHYELMMAISHKVIAD